MDLSFILISGILNGLIWCLMSLGVYISFKILDYADLTVEGTFPLGACVAGLLIFLNVPPIIATILAMLAGLLFGCLTGVLHTKLKIPAILSGILTMTGLYTINMVILGFSSKDVSTKNTLTIQTSIFDKLRELIRTIDFNNINRFRVLFIIISAFLFLLILAYIVFKIIQMIKEPTTKKLKTINLMKVISTSICCLFFLIMIFLTSISSTGISLTTNILQFINRNASYITIIFLSLLIVIVVFSIIYWYFGTEIGMSIRATGNNIQMAKAQGINTSMMIILGLGISNGLVALSGAVFAQNLGNVNVEMGRGVIVIGIASVVIGEVIFGKKDFKTSLFSIVAGSIIYYILNAIAIELNVVNYLKLVSAVLVVIILTVPLIQQKLKNKGGWKHAKN